MTQAFSKRDTALSEMATRPGRPKTGAPRLTRDEALDAALRLIDSHGARGLSFRALAVELGVSPMAVAHHVGTRHELLKAVVERVYHGVATDPGGASGPLERLHLLLTAYIRRTIEHPNVAWAVLGDPRLRSSDLESLTAELRSTIRGIGVPADLLDPAVGAVIDYTHGFALAVATQEPSSDGESSAPGLSVTDYQRGLSWLLR